MNCLKKGFSFVGGGDKKGTNEEREIDLVSPPSFPFLLFFFHFLSLLSLPFFPAVHVDPFHYYLRTASLTLSIQHSVPLLGYEPLHHQTSKITGTSHLSVSYSKPSNQDLKSTGHFSTNAFKLFPSLYSYYHLVHV